MSDTRRALEYIAQNKDAYGMQIPERFHDGSPNPASYPAAVRAQAAVRLMEMDAQAQREAYELHQRNQAEQQARQEAQLAHERALNDQKLVQARLDAEMALARARLELEAEIAKNNAELRRAELVIEAMRTVANLPADHPMAQAALTTVQKLVPALTGPTEEPK